MIKYLLGILLLVCVSCGNKEDILLPKTNMTIVKEVADLSPIYIFFKVNGKDTLAVVNRNNSISTTNWVLNIDKRLPLKLVIPEVIKLQEKKRGGSAHKNELSKNYYSYADSIGKNLAFLPFTEVFYKMEKPSKGVLIYFTNSDYVLVNGVSVEKTELKKYLGGLPTDKPKKVILCFDKKGSYESYIQNKVFFYSLKMSNVASEEAIF